MAMEASIGSQEPEVVELTRPEEVEQHLSAKRSEEMMEATALEEVKDMAKPAGAQKKTKVVRLDKEYIECLIGDGIRPLPPIPNLDCWSKEMREGILDLINRTAAAVQKDLDIQEQYFAKGYAEIIVEVDSDEEEEEYKAEQKA